MRSPYRMGLCVEVTYPAVSTSVTTVLRQRVAGRPDFEAAVPIVPSLSFRCGVAP